MIKIQNHLNQEFIYILDGDHEAYTRLISAYVFCLTVPMNLLWASEKNKVMVNGRNRPFADLRMLQGIDGHYYKWTIIYPVYSINEEERFLKVKSTYLIPPLPVECWKFYKSYSNRLEICDD